MLLVGFVAVTIAVFVSHLFLRDYWQPEYAFLVRVGNKVIGLSELMYAFFGAGIASSVYEEVYGKRFAKRSMGKYRGLYFLIPFIVAGIFIMFALNLYLGVNSMYAAFVAMLIPLVVLVKLRKDVFLDSIYSGAIFGIITAFVYLILFIIFPGEMHKWWRLDRVSGILVFGLPIEELLWAVIAGASAGPFYEFFTGRKLVGIDK